MSSRHLHVEGGGDPAQAPPDDVANPTPSPHIGNDFPDVPEANAPGTSDSSGRRPDQPDLDRFAERLGLTEAHVAADDSGLGEVRERAGRLLAAGVNSTATALRAVARSLDRVASRLPPS